jgi:hypothetical protein
MWYIECMENKAPTKICNSWYHHRWFRFVLLLVGINMLILGISFALGIDPIVLFASIKNAFARILIGAAYILVAAFVIRESISYESMREETHLVCQHCLTTLTEQEPVTPDSKVELKTQE